MAAMWAVAMSWKVLQLNQLEFEIREKTHDTIKNFLAVLQSAQEENTQAWRQVICKGVDTNAGDTRFMLKGYGHGVEVNKYCDLMRPWLRNHQETCCELHLPRFIFEWIERSNLFVNKMGFIPIGVVLDAQCSILVNNPFRKTFSARAPRQGYRLEITDARMIRASRDAKSDETTHKTFRQDHPRRNDAEKDVNYGVSFLQHTPVRNHRTPFSESMENGGMNSRVKLRNEYSRIPDNWLSRNSPIHGLDCNDIMVGECNWWWLPHQLMGFNDEELKRIKSMRLLWALTSKAEAGHNERNQQMNYARTLPRFSYY